MRYRQYLEHRARLEVAGIRSQVLECETLLDRCQKEQDETRKDLDQETTAGIAADRYFLYADYLAGIESLKEAENVRREALLQSLEEKQRELAKKSVGKKILENVKERRKDEYYKDLMRRLYKETDDTIILRKAREINK